MARPAATAPSVKICGVCHAADAAQAAAAGATYVGVILAPGYPRTRTVEEAGRVCTAAGAARRVAVFVDADEDEIIRAVRRLRLDVVQLHGAEPAEMVAKIRSGAPCEVWKTVRVRQTGDLVRAAAAYAAADALLLEGVSDRGRGGVGAGFDWSSVAEERSRLTTTRIVVAGGLTADNVARMITTLDPHVVDVSSGVEADGSEVGRKSPEQVSAFMAAVRGARVKHDR
jgi:phosphoribosylanthranilate isomerase